MNRREEYAIITGGNRGLGFYTLLGLQASGMKVIAGTKQVFFFKSVKMDEILNTVNVIQVAGMEEVNNNYLRIWKKLVFQPIQWNG